MVEERLKACPSLDSMRSYAEAAMQAGWKAAVDASVGGSLDAGWEHEWFVRNPPESAVPEYEWRTPTPADDATVERVRKLITDIETMEPELREILLQSDPAVRLRQMLAALQTPVASEGE